MPRTHRSWRLLLSATAVDVDAGPVDALAPAGVVVPSGGRSRVVIDPALRFEYMGWIVKGIEGVYEYVTLQVRKELMDALQARWERALDHLQKGSLKIASRFPPASAKKEPRTDHGPGLRRWWNPVGADGFEPPTSAL